MKKLLLPKPVFVCFLLFLFFLAACGESENKPVKDLPVAAGDNTGDTVITYDMDGISLEGAEANARYVQGQLRQCILHVLGETGQRKLVYTFSGDSINVEEEQYSYEEGILTTGGDNKLQLDTTLHYTLDTAGKVRGNVVTGYTDVFKEMKKVVPRTLTK